MSMWEIGTGINFEADIVNLVIHFAKVDIRCKGHSFDILVEIPHPF